MRTWLTMVIASGVIAAAITLDHINDNLARLTNAAVSCAVERGGGK